MLIRGIIFIGLLTCVTLATAQSAYRCTDASGTVEYRDSPCSIQRESRVPTSDPASSTSGKDFVPGDICVEQLKTRVAFKDPDSVKVLSKLRKAGADLIDWNGIRVEALQFDLLVDAKNSYGAYTGGESYRCDIGLDSRRVFSIQRRK